MVATHIVARFARAQKKVISATAAKNIKLKFVEVVDVRHVLTKPKTLEEQEHIDNLISIRDDLWLGEKTREEIEDELNLDSEFSDHLEKFFKGKK